ncbi:hypothetical protein [Winogradskyella sp. A3E31]|uniref:hypothetical protein n=1 Tax=Winogradskyella sp. A3E31 TaxID=3349637 RepID=UPI00398B8C70
MIKIIFRQFILLMALLPLTLCSAQEESLFPLDKFKAYTELPRENIFVHLNKSTLLKGEMLGFSVYTFNKNSKTPSLQTTTIYCTIIDDNGKLVKKKMLKAEKGIAFNVFNIDSSFTSGNYKFRAYTNWMLNFNEPNYFETYISIIDPESVNKESSGITQREIDIQMLPEGGHLVENCQNTIAIIAKDTYGYGIPNLEGKIIDSKENIVALFKLNDFGIGKTIFTPTENDTFKLIVDNNNFTIKKVIKNVRPIGFNLSALERRDKLLLSFKTNEKSLNIIGNDTYNVVIHNGKDLKTSSFSFNGEREVIRVFETSTLFNGINIITVFNSQNKPILERLFFNYNDIKKTSVNVNKEIVISDSISLKLKVNKTIDTSKINNLSISVLPSKSASYMFNSNILSKIYLEPYLNGYIENASYYFRDSELKTKYALDNLLISQGWSSYDWTEIFNNPPIITHNFENGIIANVNFNNKEEESTYLTYPLTHNPSEIITLSSKDNSYRHEQLFPLEDEMYKIIQGFKKRRKGEKPDVYIQFFPSSFPKFNFEKDNRFVLLNKTEKMSTSQIDNIDLSWAKDIEVLDEVLITTNLKKERIESISNKFYGDVDVFDDRDRRRNQTFANYITTRGFIATEFRGTLRISPRVQTSTNDEPLIFLDGVQLLNYSVFLYQFNMNIVDYVIINRSGHGEGMRGAAGVIRIFTNPSLAYTASNKEVLASSTFPLTFASSKKYYTPKYQSYTNRTFEEFGVIDWKPNLQFNDKGKLEIKIPDTFQETIVLYIEGVLNGNSLISEEKIININ